MENNMTTSFIDQLAAGQSAEAKEALADMLSARAFEALDARKQELASTIFGNKEEVAQEPEATVATEEPETQTETE